LTGLKERIVATVRALLGGPWAPFVLAVAACVDIFVVVIPTDAIFLAVVLANPKRWLSAAFMVSLGSVLGAALLAAALQAYGADFIRSLFPSLMDSSSWTRAASLMADYGNFAIFFIGLTPLSQQPVVILSALAGNSVWGIAFCLLAGRLPKYFGYAWVVKRAPNLLDSSLGRLMGWKEKPEHRE